MSDEENTSINDGGELSAKEQKFVELYIGNGGNATKAYLDAGYAENGAAQNAARMIAKDKIKGAIGRRMHNIMAPMQINSTEIIMNQVLNATSDIMDFLDVDDRGYPKINLVKNRAKTRVIEAIEITELPAMTIVENGVEYAREVVKIKLKLWNKNQSAEFMGKHLGLLSPAPGAEEEDQSDTKANAMSVMDVCKRIAFLFAQAEQARKHRDATAITVEEKPSE